ncbi:MAG: hypothetical protein ACRCZM_08780 [Bacteroidales bacterium]
MKSLILALIFSFALGARCWAVQPSDSLSIALSELGLSTTVSAPSGVYSFVEQVALLDAFYGIDLNSNSSIDEFMKSFRSQIEPSISGLTLLLPNYNWKVTNKKSSWTEMANIGGNSKSQRSNFPKLQLLDPTPKFMRDAPVNLKYMPDVQFLVKFFALLQVIETIFNGLPNKITLTKNILVTYKNSRVVLQWKF